MLGATAGLQQVTCSERLRSERLRRERLRSERLRRERLCSERLRDGRLRNENGQPVVAMRLCRGSRQ